MKLLDLSKTDYCESIRQGCDLLLQLRGARRHLVDLRGELLDLGLLLLLLGVGLAQLLVAEGLLRGVRLGLGLELLDHVADEVLDLAEDVLAVGVRHGGDAGGELGKLGGVVLVGQVAHEAGRLELGEAGLGGDPGGDLHEGVGLIGRAAGHLLDDLLGLGDGGQLLAAALLV